MLVKNANPVSWLLRSVLFGVSLLFVAGCGGSQAPDTPPVPKTIADFFDIKVGNVNTHIQIAISQLEQERGLMQRRDLQPDDGMIFPYRTPQTLNFWMRNTPTPLDIGYFDSKGVLLEVYPMYPYDETAISSHSTEIQYALEMRQGWYASHGVKPGAKMDMAALAAAIKARGFKPEDYGLQ